MAVTRDVRLVTLIVLLGLAWGPSIGSAQSTPDQPNSSAARANTLQVKTLQEAWLEFRQTRFNDQPILLHLRRGYERAVLMPEPIRLQDDSQVLPGCAVQIDTDVVGFFPTETFARQSIKFVGLETGTVYDLRVRASPDGIRQPLQITR